MSEPPADVPKSPDAAAPKKKLTPEQAEAMLREAAGQRRPSKLAIGLWWLLLFGLPLALLIWWSWPPSAGERLSVTALDAVVAEGQDYQFVAQLEPLESSVTKPNLNGQLVFFEPAGGEAMPDQPAPAVEVVADRVGRATLPGTTHAQETIIPFAVSHVDATRSFRSYDQGRVFIWPVKTSMLIVPLSALWQAPRHAERLEPDKVDAAAPGALKRVGEQGVKVIYLDDLAQRHVEVRLHRGLLEVLASRENAMPSGPVISGLSKGDDWIAGLKKQFTGDSWDLHADQGNAWVLRSSRWPPVRFESTADAWKELTKHVQIERSP